jgi:hypothetical protein
MSQVNEKSPRADGSIEAATARDSDAGKGDGGAKNRRPYEAPRIVKKRSVAHATLQTVMGVSMTGLTMSG